MKKKMETTPVFLPGESHGQRSLMGYSLWGHKESDGACVYFWAFYLVPLVYVSVFVQYHTVLMTVALQYNLKSRRLIPPAPFFFLNTALAIQGLLYFHMNCENFCSSSVKNATGNLIGTTLYLQIALRVIVIFTILILPTQEHGISLHLFILSLIYFISVL